MSVSIHSIQSQHLTISLIPLDKVKYKVGDYVRCKKPFAGKYPIGIIKEIETRKFIESKYYDGINPVYVVWTPTDDPKKSRCDEVQCWRQANGLVKSSKKSYTNQYMLRAFGV